MHDLKFLILTLLLSSCAWNQENLSKIKRKEVDIVKDFDLDNELVKKFAEAKPVVANRILKKKKKKKKKEKRRQKRVKIKKTLKTIKPSRYPKDYPKKFKEYNKKYGKYWKFFSPKVFYGEEMEIDVKYIGVTAGKIIMRTLSNKIIGTRETYHFRADLKSAPFYSYIYKLDDYLESFLDVETYLPLKYTLIQRESGQSVDDLQVFDYEKLKTFFWYKKIKKGKIKNEKLEKFIPAYFQDSFSALPFFRGLPLKIGETYEFPIVTRGKIWIVKAIPEKVETIKIKKKRYQALRIKAETKFPGVLKKKGDILFWFSNDVQRKILKFEAKVKIGTIEGILVRYKTGNAK